MRRKTSTLPLTVVTVLSLGCQTQTQTPVGTLAEIKRHQEQRLMYACLSQYATIENGGLSLDLIQACQKDADARVW